MKIMESEEFADSALTQNHESTERQTFAAKPQTDKKMHPVVMQQMKQPRCKSSVWVYFQRLDTAVAKCRICNGNYRFGSSISNLRHHAQVKHSEILKQGPVKFLERLKVPEEQLHKLFNSTRKGKKRSPRMTVSKEKSSVVDECLVKVEPTTITDIDASSFEDEAIQKTIESIYEKGDDSIVDYMRTGSSIAPAIRLSDSYMRLESSNANSLNDDEPEIDFLRSQEFINSNPLNTATTNSCNDERLQRLKEERVKAETNYFNKKAAYMERSAEYVDVQKRHLLLQTKKLRMEIAAMKDEGAVLSKDR